MPPHGVLWLARYMAGTTHTNTEGASTMTTITDHRNTPIAEGDTVVLVYYGGSIPQHMMQGRHTVVGFTTRGNVKVASTHEGGHVRSIRPDALRVVEGFAPEPEPATHDDAGLFHYDDCDCGECEADGTEGNWTAASGWPLSDAVVT